MLPPTWSAFFGDVGIVLGTLTGLAAFLALISRYIVKGFGRGVKAHVEPLVSSLALSLDGIATTVRDLQGETSRTTERIVRDLDDKHEILAAQAAKLESHAERLAKHDTRLAVVEVRLEA